VTTLNCTQQDHHADGSNTPEHQRNRLSIKKTGALGKAVRSKLTKTLYNSMDGIKPKSSLKLLDSHVSEDHQDDKSPTSPSQPPSNMGRMSASSSTSSAGNADKSKKRSKLCSLL